MQYQIQIILLLILSNIVCADIDLDCDGHGTLIDGEICQCNSNYYGIQSCSKCPNETSCQNGSTQISQCTCPSSNYKPISESNQTCICDAGFYGDATVQDGCQQCPPGTTSQPGSTQISQCTCPSSNYKPISESNLTCICNAGYYGDATVQDGCKLCPSNSSSNEGKTTIDQCTCTAQHTVSLSLTQTTCVCSSGYYGTATIADSCELCPTGTSSQDGSTQISECTCPSQNYKPISVSNQTCICDAGFYGDATVQDGCQECPPGTTSQPGSTQISHCTCPSSNYKPISESNLTCICNAGYYGDATVQDGCKLCPSNSSSAEGKTTIDQCTCTAQHTVSLSLTQTTCVCSSGYYGTATTTNSCELCPSGTSSQPGSTQISECTCPSSNYKPISVSNQTCICDAGFYGDATVQDGCQECPPGTTSQPGSTQISHCTCPSSNYKPISESNLTCICNAGYYGDATVQDGCKLCPSNSSSSEGKTTIDQCTCTALHALPLSLTQTTCVCSSGYYGTATTTNSCELCPSGTSSQDGSSQISQCTCPSQNYKPISVSNQTCICDAGFYGDATVQDGCQQCPPGTTSQPGSTQISQCTCLSSNYKPISESNLTCICKAGYYGDATVQDGCKLCPSNSSSNEGKTTIDQCTCTALHTVSLSLTQTTCVCSSGYYGTATTADSCELCPSGTSSQDGSTQISECTCPSSNYKPISESNQTCICDAGFYGDATVQDGCQECPPGTTSQPGSTQISHCTCLSSNYKPISESNLTCICNAGYYGDAKVLNGCKQCPSNSSSAEGKQTIDQCTCTAQHTLTLSLTQTTCVCSSGYYGTATTADSCELCPSGMSSQVGSTLISQCTCASSNYKPISETNQTCICKAGYYGDATVQDGCKLCPSNSSSNEGKTTIDQCTCTAQHTLSLSLTQTTCVCSSGYYGTATTADSCELCPSGTSSQDGSTQISQCTCPSSNYKPISQSNLTCICDAGYYGDATVQDGCQQCPPGSTSQSGSTQISQCTCLSSNYKPISESNSTCICNAGNYGDAKVVSGCKQCPTNSSSAEGKQTIDQCTCTAQHTVSLSLTQTTCVCSSGYYGTATTADSCELCPSGATSQPGSTQISQCTCPSSNYKPISDSNKQCICNSGYYGDAKVVSGCKLCPSNSSSAEGKTTIDQCTCTAQHTVSLSLTQTTCVCSSGYYGTATTADSCELCPSGATSQPGSTQIAQCTCPSSNYKPISDSNQTCICDVGYYGNANIANGCQKCPTGTTSNSGSTQISQCTCTSTNYKPISDQNKTCICDFGYYGNANIANGCQKCPTGATSNSGSTQISDCTCPSTNYRPISDNNKSCICETGFYGDATKSNGCKQCPDHSTSQYGSIDISQCLCQDKNALSLSNQQLSCQCKKNYYGTANNQNPCQLCPTGSTSPSGSTQITQCICPDSNFATLTDQNNSCQCKEGFYGSGTDVGSCQQCPANSKSQQGAKNISNCQCLDSNTNTLTSENPICQCKIGYYGSATSQNSCQKCPDGQTTENSGSDSINQCISIDCTQTPKETEFTNAWCRTCQTSTPFASKNKSKCIISNCSNQPNNGQYSNTWCSDCDTQKKYSNLENNSCVISDCANKPTSGSYTDQWCSDCSTINTATTDKKGCGNKSDDSNIVTKGEMLASLTSLLIILVNLLF